MMARASGSGAQVVDKFLREVVSGVDVEHEKHRLLLDDQTLRLA